MLPAIHIHLLGDFRLVYGNEPLTGVGTARLQALRHRLAARAGDRAESCHPRRLRATAACGCAASGGTHADTCCRVALDWAPARVGAVAGRLAARHEWSITLRAGDRRGWHRQVTTGRRAVGLGEPTRLCRSEDARLRRRRAAILWFGDGVAAQRTAAGGPRRPRSGLAHRSGPATPRAPGRAPSFASSRAIDRILATPAVL